MNPTVVEKAFSKIFLTLVILILGNYIKLRDTELPFESDQPRVFRMCFFFGGEGGDWDGCPVTIIMQLHTAHTHHFWIISKGHGHRTKSLYDFAQAKPHSCTSLRPHPFFFHDLY